MSRKPFEITKESALSIIRWRCSQLADDPATPWTQKVALRAAANSGHLKLIVDEVYNVMDLSLSANANNPEHVTWLQAGAIVARSSAL